MKNAEIKTTRSLSPIWILPLVALLIAAWMLYQYQLTQGTTIKISMPNAEGIVVGKTEIKVRSVKMGVISSVVLAPDQSHVIAYANIDQNYNDLLTTDAMLWLVEPRIDETGISGLGTLLSGVYLEFLPGQAEQATDEFKLLEGPPLISDTVAGGRYLLYSRLNEVAEVGTGIYYKGYKVGQIETAEFDWRAQTMRYGLFIRAPYDNLISQNIIFWQNSALEVDLSADGINVKTGSLAKMLKGGISFAVPNGEASGALAKNNHIFRLSKDYKSALEQRYDNFDYYVIQFEQSIRGLKVGAPVEYRGIRIGTVVEAPAMLVVGDRPAHFSTESTAVPVKIKIEYKRIFHDADIAKEFWQGNVASWIERGLRASLKTGNLLTGAIYVDFDMYQGVEPFNETRIAGLRVFPSTSSGFSVLANQVSDVLNKINELNIEQPLSSLNLALSEYNKLAVDLRTMINSQRAQQLPHEMSASLNQIQNSMASFDVTMQQFKKTMSDYQQGSAVYSELTKTLQQLETIAEQLQPLSKSINEQPNILIFDKALQPDLIPTKEQ